MKPQHCPLCHSPMLEDYFTDKKRCYRQCQNCSLVHVPLRYHLTAVEEKAEYDLHQNSLDDAGYRAFLTRLFEPLNDRLCVPQHGLDFGCGPGPLLAQMFAEQGHRMEVFDVFYANNPAVLDQTYDFISCTEVVEHLAQPSQVLEQLWGMIRPGGWLALMTKLLIDKTAFAGWHYKNDPTHMALLQKTNLDGIT